MSTVSSAYHLLCSLYRKVLQKESLRRCVEDRGLPQTWFAPLERRVLFNSVSWDGGGDGTNWTDPRNWSGDLLPVAADDVTINVAGNPTIQITTGTQAVNTLAANNTLLLSGGTLQVNQS